MQLIFFFFYIFKGGPPDLVSIVFAHFQGGKGGYQIPNISTPGSVGEGEAALPPHSVPGWPGQCEGGPGDCQEWQGVLHLPGHSLCCSSCHGTQVNMGSATKPQVGVSQIYWI